MPTESKDDDWWDCPTCGEETRMCIDEPGPDRECTECDWSVRIPRKEEVR